MVAKTISLPNIRKLFKPDPGMFIIDSDFEQADARIVAWDANAPKLKEIFHDTTKDLHSENATSIYGRVDKRTRALAKRGVHATNYVITARGLASSLGISLAEAELFINTWFSAHPQIPEWHDRIADQLARTRTIQNAFGYRKVFYDRVDRILPEAVAWIPQSTVAIAINKALYNIYKNLPQVQILIQVHDSLVMQAPRRLFPGILKDIEEQMKVPIPYEDPLILPTSCEVSTLSWGHKRTISWDGDFKPTDTMTAFEAQRAAGF